jgi:hypothetical protein
MKLVTMQFLHPPVTSSLLRPTMSNRVKHLSIISEGTVQKKRGGGAISAGEQAAAKFSKHHI